MSFSVEQQLPENYFQEVMDAQTEMVKMYLNDLENLLVFSHYYGNMMATFKFYSSNENDASPHYTTLFLIWGIWKISCITFGYK